VGYQIWPLSFRWEMLSSFLLLALAAFLTTLQGRALSAPGVEILPATAPILEEPEVSFLLLDKAEKAELIACFWIRSVPIFQWPISAMHLVATMNTEHPAGFFETWQESLLLLLHRVPDPVERQELADFHLLLIDKWGTFPSDCDFIDFVTDQLLLTFFAKE